MLIPTDGICICTATHFGFGVGLGFGEADGLAESPAEPLPLGEAVACAMPDWVGSGMGGRLWPGACWSRSSWPRTISDTPARASRIGTEKPGRMRRRTDASLATGGGGESARALAIARTALAAQPAGLVTDLDGTLAPIVPVPSEAMLLPVASDALRALAGRLAVVAVITGRAALDARRMLGSAGNQALVIGNHGPRMAGARRSGSRGRGRAGGAGLGHCRPDRAGAGAARRAGRGEGPVGHYPLSAGSGSPGCPGVAAHRVGGGRRRRGRGSRGSPVDRAAPRWPRRQG